MPGLETLLAIGANVSGLVTGLNQGLGVLERFGQTIEGIMDSVVRSVEQAIHVIGNLSKQIISLSMASARLDSMRDSFNKMTAEFGVTGQQMLAVMNEATLGMVRDADLIESSMTAMMLINQRALGDITETIPKLAQIATAAARALGTDVDYMFASITRGIGRASPMILDNLGFTIRLGEVYGDFAKSVGKTTKELTIEEKQMALLNVVLEKGDAYVERLGISTGGLATKTKQLHKVLADLKDVVGQAFMPMVQALQSWFSDLAVTIINKVIPAFRMLARVFSEVFGVKNPFMRWIEGDVVQQTTARIQSLYSQLLRLKELGPDFAGAVTAALEEFTEGIAELDEKFGPRFAAIQTNLAERVADIWADFRRSQERRDEDFKKEERRRTEDHYERMKEIRDRYDQDIADAVRNRDARALLNLLRSRREELNAEEDSFQKEGKRRQEDRELERQRAEEDARLREAEAREAAAKEFAALQEEYDKAAAKLAEARDKALQAAEISYEQEAEYLREQIEKQTKLREEQMLEVEKLRAEMDQPLPPFFEKLRDILSVIWGWLQKVSETIKGIVSGEMEVQLPEWILKIADAIRVLWEVEKEALGPEFLRIWRDLQQAFEELRPYLPDIGILLTNLAKVVIPTLVISLHLFVAGLSATANALEPLIRMVGGLLENITKFLGGIVLLVAGNLEILVGIFTGNFLLIQRGIERLVGVGKLIFEGFFGFLITLFRGSLDVILTFVFTFVDSVIDSFRRLSDTLVGHSIIPDMLTSIKTSIFNFVDEALEKWRSGWTEMGGIVQLVWNDVVGTITGSISLIIEKIIGWIEDLTVLIPRLFEPLSTSLAGVFSGFSSAAFSSIFNLNANGWNVYSQGGGNAGGDVFDALTGVIGGTGGYIEQWRRR